MGLSAGAGFLLEETDAKREDDGRVNGEVVRERVEGWRWGQGVRGGVAAVAWGMCVVGIWGDGV